MKRTDERIVIGVIFVITGLFLIINQFMFKISFFPWILLVIGVFIFLISLFSANFWGGLQALLWLGGLSFALYYDQILPGILIIIGTSIILGGFKQVFTKTHKVEININEKDNSEN